MTKEEDPHPAHRHIIVIKPTQSSPIRECIVLQLQKPFQTSCWFMSIDQTPKSWSKKRTLGNQGQTRPSNQRYFVKTCPTPISPIAPPPIFLSPLLRLVSCAGLLLVQSDHPTICASHPLLCERDSTLITFSKLICARQCLNWYDSLLWSHRT